MHSLNTEQIQQIIPVSYTHLGYPDGTRCKVSLNEKNRDNYAEVSVGDEVVVYYDGKIAESDPLQINTVYGITLKNSVD